jgi:glycine cleavage system P protein (glycine dehydrogenase) subunit 1
MIAARPAAAAQVLVHPAVEQRLRICSADSSGSHVSMQRVSYDERDDMGETVHPYIPNSAPDAREAMLAVIGVDQVDALYREIPDRLRFKRPLDLPEPCHCEYELERYVRRILARNVTCDDYLNFLGGGCEQHHVPAVVDAVIGRGEFLTAYFANAYTDNGAFQALFEYQSLLCDLLGMDVAGYPLTCGLHASGTAVRMAARITGRSQVLVPATMNPRRLQEMMTYCEHSEATSIATLGFDPASGLLDSDELEEKLSSAVACVLVESPSYLGGIESQMKHIADAAHTAGALLVACVNPISLGVLASPGEYGADIACGDSQPLGVRMNYGGGATGFVATREIAEHMAELPNQMVNITAAGDGGSIGFTMYAYPERLSYRAREAAKDYTGTNAALWAIANAVYLSLMGPQGMREIGETIIRKTQFAKQLMAAVPGLALPLAASSFNEFVVNFDATSRSVKEINEALLERRIFGGVDLSGDFPSLGQSALYCVSEMHSADDLHALVRALREVTR